MTRSNSLAASRLGAALAAIASVALTAVGIDSGVTASSHATAPPSIQVTYAGLDVSQPVAAQPLAVYHSDVGHGHSAG